LGNSVFGKAFGSRLRFNAKPCCEPGKETAMRHLTALVASLFFTPWAAWATTSPTTPTPAPGAGTPAAGTGGIADYWWIIVLVIIAAVAIWYFMSRKRTTL
jgi:hypothetical protein